MVERGLEPTTSDMWVWSVTAWTNLLGWPMACNWHLTVGGGSMWDEEQPPDGMQGSFKFPEYPTANSRQGVVLLTKSRPVSSPAEQLMEFLRTPLQTSV